MLSESARSFHIGFSAAVENIRWVRKHFQNQARREWWSIHIEAWQRSGLSQRPSERAIPPRADRSPMHWSTAVALDVPAEKDDP